MSSDYVDMRKWRRLALFSFAAFIFATAVVVYQAYRISVDEAWMIKAYHGLEVCRDLLAPQAQ